MLLGRAGRYDSAAATLDSAVGILTPAELNQLYNNIAQIAANKRDFEHSMAFLEKSLQLNPNSPAIYGNMFLLRNYLNERDQAAAIIERYLKQFPADTAVATELEKFRQGGAFDVKRTFGFGS